MSNTVNHLLNQNRLANAGPAEEADLAALDVRGEQVENLDAGLQHLGLGLQVIESRRIAMDRPALGDLDGRRIDVEDVTGHVPHVALGDIAHRHSDRGAGVTDLGATAQTVSRLERDGTHDVLADVQGHLEGDGMGLTHHLGVDVKGIEDLRHLSSRKLDVDDGADDTDDAANAGSLVLRLGGNSCRSHDVLSHSCGVDSARAAAPPTISVISWVMAA